MEDHTPSDAASPADTSGAVSSQQQWAGWILIAVLLLLEYGFFRQYAEREIAWSYPSNHDQTGYLWESYATYDTILKRDVWRGLKHGYRVPTANGMMLPVQGALLYLVLGPSRLSALTLNFLYLAAAQLVLVWTVRRLSGRWSVALTALGLFLSITAMFNPAGGLMDFRIDCTAMCLFGIFVCLVVRSGMFASWGWSLAVGGVAGLLVTFRFLTSLYMASIFGCMLLFFCGRLCLRWRDPAVQALVRRQLRGLLSAGLLVYMLAAHVVLQNLPEIHYYYVGHVLSGDNAARNREFGVNDLLDRIAYYPKTIFEHHGGVTFFALAGVILLVGMAALMLRWFRRADATTPRPRLAGAFTFCLVCALVPMVVLTGYGSPSPVVGSIVMIPLVCVVVLAMLGMSGLPLSGRPRVWAGALAAIALTTGGFSYASNLSKRNWMSRVRPEIESVLQIYDEIARCSTRAGLRVANVSANFLCDYLPPSWLPTAYERHRLLVRTKVKYPHTSSLTEALAMMDASDFVIMNMAVVPEGAEHPLRSKVYPFMQGLYDARPQMLAVCEKEFTLVKRFTAFGDELRLYMRSSLLPPDSPESRTGNLP